jgi:hypothetical protein
MTSAAVSSSLIAWAEGFPPLGAGLAPSVLAATTDPGVTLLMSIRIDPRALNRTTIVAHSPKVSRSGIRGPLASRMSSRTTLS